MVLFRRFWGLGLAVWVACGLPTAGFGQTSYLRADMGVAVTDNDSAISYSGGLGTSLPLGVRVDATANYASYDGKPTYVIDDLNRFDTSRSEVGVEALTGFVGVYYDIPDPVPGVEPFIGAGAGLARMETDGAVISVRASSAQIEVTSETVVEPAFFVTAGVSLDMFEQVSIDIAYRYTDLGAYAYKATLRDGTVSANEQTPDIGTNSAPGFTAGTISQDMNSHEALVSLRLAF